MIEILEQINWDFAEASTNTATNTIHPYPAKFIPQIPYHFIQQLSKVGDTVYEPFLGSGTTAVEANILGRNAIGNDVNELAVLISKVKTTPISNKKLHSLDSLLNKVYNRIDLLHSGKKNGILKPDIVNLDLWFEEFVINELVIIKEEIEKLGDKKNKNDLGIPLPLQTHKQTHRQGRAFRYNLFSQRSNANAEKRIFTSIPNAA